MARIDAALPMSDRRAVLAVVDVLTAAPGLAIGLLSLLGLRYPVGATGDLGTPTDLTSLLVGLLRLGGVLVVVGAGTTIAPVLAQRR